MCPSLDYARETNITSGPVFGEPTKVSAILKTPAKFGKPKEVHIGQSGLAKITSADIRFRAGQQGIWLLSKDPGQNKVVVMKGEVLAPDPERNVYWAKHPSQFQSEKEQKK